MLALQTANIAIIVAHLEDRSVPFVIPVKPQIRMRLNGSIYMRRHEKLQMRSRLQLRQILYMELIVPSAGE